MRCKGNSGWNPVYLLRNYWIIIEYVHKQYSELITLNSKSIFDRDWVKFWSSWVQSFNLFELLKIDSTELAFIL